MSEKSFIADVMFVENVSFQEVEINLDHEIIENVPIKKCFFLQSISLTEQLFQHFPIVNVILEES